MNEELRRFFSRMGRPSAAPPPGRYLRNLLTWVGAWEWLDRAVPDPDGLRAAFGEELRRDTFDSVPLAAVGAHALRLVREPPGDVPGPNLERVARLWELLAGRGRSRAASALARAREEIALVRFGTGRDYRVLCPGGSGV